MSWWCPPFEVSKYDTSPLGNGKNWVTREGGLPLFVRAVAHALMRKGMSKSQAIAIGVSNMHKGSAGEWGKKKSGAPGHATPPTQAKAGENLSEWEVKRADADVKKDGFTVSAQISKVDEDKRTVFGWAYVTHDPEGDLNVDKSGEFIDSTDELESMAYDFVLESRHGGADHVRESGNPLVKSTMIESMVFTPEKIAQMGVPEGSLPVGWWTGWKVHDDDAWQGVKDGKYTSFSIHGTGLRKAVKT